MMNVRPSWWNFFWHILICWVIAPGGVLYLKYEGFFAKVDPLYWRVTMYFVFGCVVVTFIVILWGKLSLKFTVHEDRVVLKKGVLSKDIKEIFIKDIRTIDIKQSLVQRIIGIGDVMIASSGTSGYEMYARGLPNPNGIREIILKFREKVD